MNSLKSLSRFINGKGTGSRRISRKNGGLRVEPLEERQLLTTLSVDVGTSIRTLPSPPMIGANVSQYDPYVTTSQESNGVIAGGLKLLRLSSGASGDDDHFTDALGVNTYDSVQDEAGLAQRSKATAILTVNYAGGSPQEAAAYLAYLTKSPSTPDVNLGVGRYFDKTTKQWIDKDWKTANYWANLRNGPAYTSVSMVEVGNEVYGSWNPDHHGSDPTLPNDRPHDPATYVAFVKQFAGLVAQFAPKVSIGVDVATPTASEFLNWDTQVLADLAGGTSYMPGFLADHNYMYDVGQENDQTLLRSTATLGLPNDNTFGTTSDVSWQARAVKFRTLLSQDFGSNSSKVQLIATELNSVAGDGDTISKQTTSLVNGLFLADAVGGLLQPGYNSRGQVAYKGYDGGLVWNLRNNYYGTGSGNARSQPLYGWRTGGDYGLFGADKWNGGGNNQSNTNIAYPSYYGMQMASQLVSSSAKVLKASTDSTGLAIYATQASNGMVTLLVINKNAPGTNGADVSATLNFAGKSLSGTWTVLQYGVSQDNAQKAGHSVNETLPSISFPTAGQASFTYTFPAYSMTLLQGYVITPSAIAAPTTSGSASPSVVVEVNSSETPLAPTAIASKPKGDTVLPKTNNTQATPDENSPRSGVLVFNVEPPSGPVAFKGFGSRKLKAAGV